MRTHTRRSTAPPRSAARDSDIAAVPVAPILTPRGQLQLARVPDAPALDAEVADRLESAFARGSGHGLLQLGAGEVGSPLPALLGYWREFAGRYVAVVCALPGIEERRARAEIPGLTDAELAEFAAAAPPMTGAEYLTADALRGLWDELDAAFRSELSEWKGPVEQLLARWSPAWHLVGRVHLNLAENRHDDEAPFAFLATYTARLTSHARAQHLPLGEALREYAGARNKARLLSLLVPVQRAAETCGWLRDMVDAGEIFHPLRWTAREAFQLLTDLPQLEAAGVVVRVPRAWRGSRPPRPVVTASVGGRPPSRLGQDALLDFRMAVTLDGEPLTDAEIAGLLAGSQGLHLIRGRWVEVDPERLRRMLDEFREVEQTAAAEGLSFAEAMRLIAGARVDDEGAPAADPDWSRVVAGPWLAETLAGLRSPAGLAHVDPGPELHAALRPYQQVGVRWLYLLSRLGLGACLADDMGLGKTIQVLSLLLVLRTGRTSTRRTSLLVAPASILANWMSEIERFAPGLRAIVAHPSAMSADELRALGRGPLPDVDLIVTTYGSLLRLPWIAATPWRLVVLDEAQAIKNPGAKQTQSVKRLDAEARIALTGTPIENRLSDLWSIFDFLNPGLLGSARAFTQFAKLLANRPHNPYAPLRELVRPYILRRLKTDRSVIADLPDKTEVTAFCPLSPRQAALYQRSVTELAERLEHAHGIHRKGLVLSFLTRFKQICNHPSHWLGDGAWREADSGKLGRLREIAEVIAARQEKVLVFTQFREVTAPLAAFLTSVFGRPGPVLHGETPVARRKELVRRFQEDEDAPFFVLSLRAGGAGLNLTAASHVVHFDRWWNPAVENQATDRAFRIGQTKNVLVHKLVCRGTVEEKIEQLIASKRELVRELLDDTAEVLLTELSDDELLKLVALDVNAALRES